MTNNTSTNNNNNHTYESHNLYNLTTYTQLNKNDLTTGLDSTTVIVDHTNRNVAIILGSFFGALIFVLAFFVILYLIFKRKLPIRKDFSMRRFRMGNTAEMDTVKIDPSVLLLYSYDCAAHEKVVMVLATYLKEVCQLDVHLDIWDQNIIHEQGVISWINKKLDMVQFVVIICSKGARIKCATNRNVRVVQDRPGKFDDDLFQTTVSVVIDKMHEIKSGVNGTTKLQNYIVIYFEYSSTNEIPPKLDSAPTFCLTKDMHKFEHHIRKRMHDDRTSTLSSSGTSTISTRTHRSDKSFESQYKRIVQTEIGKDLVKTVNDAKEFFKNNPDWLGDILEPMHMDRSVTSTTTIPLSPNSEDETILIEQRQKKRRDRQETLKSPTDSNSTGVDILSDSEMLAPRIPLEVIVHEKKRPLTTNITTNNHHHSNGTPKFIVRDRLNGNNDDDDGCCGGGGGGGAGNDSMEDDELLKRDIDYIRNLSENTPPPWKKPTLAPLVLNASTFAPLTRLDAETPTGDRIVHVKIDKNRQAVFDDSPVTTTPTQPAIISKNIKLQPPPQSPHRRLDGRGVVR